MVEAVKKFSQKRQLFNRFKVAGISLLIGGLIFSGFQVGEAGRDRDILHDTYLFGQIIEEGTLVHLEESQEDPPPNSERFKLIPLNTKTYQLYEPIY